MTVRAEDPSAAPHLTQEASSLPSDSRPAYSRLNTRAVAVTAASEGRARSRLLIRRECGPTASDAGNFVTFPVLLASDGQTRATHFVPITPTLRRRAVTREGIVWLPFAADSASQGVLVNGRNAIIASARTTKRGTLRPSRGTIRCSAAALALSLPFVARRVAPLRANRRDDHPNSISAHTVFDS